MISNFEKLIQVTDTFYVPHLVANDKAIFKHLKPV